MFRKISLRMITLWTSMSRKVMLRTIRLQRVRSQTVDLCRIEETRGQRERA